MIYFQIDNFKRFMTKPSFNIVWALFSSIFLHGDERTRLSHVAKVIGGKVRHNIEAGIFTNSCALRLSYVLNYSGVTIPYMSGKTSSGGDGRWYIPRVKDLIQFLEVILGKPDHIFKHHPSPNQVKGKGILVFEVSGWQDVSGHATLWNGAACSDACYFGQAQKVHLWILK